MYRCPAVLATALVKYVFLAHLSAGYNAINSVFNSTIGELTQQLFSHMLLTSPYIMLW